MNKIISIRILLSAGLFLLCVCMLMLAMIFQSITSPSKIESSTKTSTQTSTEPSKKYDANLHDSSKNHNISSNTNLATFTIGSSLAEVRAIHGTPSDLLKTGKEQEVWFYRDSRIFFSNGLVAEVDDLDNILNFEESDKKDE